MILTIALNSNTDYDDHPDEAKKLIILLNFLNRNIKNIGVHHEHLYFYLL